MDDFDLKIKEIKISRSVYAFLDDIFMNIEKFTNERYPNSIFYKKDNILLFEIKNNLVYYKVGIYFTLKEKYHCSHSNILDLFEYHVRKIIKFEIYGYTSFNSFRYSVIQIQLI